jgi:HEPN domain-containing protein
MPYSLYLEKLLKALVVEVTQEHAPLTHNLVLLAERFGLVLSDYERRILTIITDYNLITRYPKNRKLAKEKYTKEFSKNEIGKIKEMAKWVLSKLKQSEN